MEISALEMIARVALAALLGAALGVEREIQQKPAGLRTHTFVAAGAALFTVVGASVTVFGSDPTRVSTVVTGIGFIGAGGMIKTGFTMSAITTAATLWFGAALGVGTGFGLYGVSVAALIVAPISMLGFAPMRKYLRSKAVLPLEIEYYVGHRTLTPVFETPNAMGAQIQRMSMVEDEGKRRLSLEITRLGSEAMDGSCFRFVCARKSSGSAVHPAEPSETTRPRLVANPRPRSDPQE